MSHHLELAKSVSPWELDSMRLPIQEELPPKPGIYFVYRARQVLYIGSTITSFADRWKRHDKRQVFERLSKIDDPVYLACYPLHCDSEVIRSIETALIDAWRPSHNVKDNVDFDSLLLQAQDSSVVKALNGLVECVIADFCRKIHEQEQQIDGHLKSVEALRRSVGRYRILISRLKAQLKRIHSLELTIQSSAVLQQELDQSICQREELLETLLQEIHENLSEQLL